MERGEAFDLEESESKVAIKGLIYFITFTIGGCLERKRKTQRGDKETNAAQAERNDGKAKTFQRARRPTPTGGRESKRTKKHDSERNWMNEKCRSR